MATRAFVGLTVVWALLVGASSAALGADGLSYKEAARRTDTLLKTEVFSNKTSGTPDLAGVVDDETFLRRVTLDLVGTIPTPAEVTAFALDTTSTKRAAAIDRLLKDGRYGDNWARYWRDVILYRRSDDRALLVAGSLEEYLAKQLNDGVGWDAIARDFITARGNVREKGNAALVMAQMATAEDVTAETARIFLGIQIQCAQCHDHPTDRWKRAQFHELTAFFTRVGVRPVKGDGPRSFEVFGRDRGPEKLKNEMARAGALEHRMPDLKDPGAPGTVMKPVFFVTGKSLNTGTTDTVRRTSLAEWITAKDDPWFARAAVNRLWSELVGEGFYEPVDDMGPDRQCSAPKTLDLLAKQFAAHDYDLKWLMKTIMATDAYQRQSRPRRNTDETPFVANCRQRLRADQLYDALTTALELPVVLSSGPAMGPRRLLQGPRAQFAQTFGFDPSNPRDELAGSIPQALMLMNAPQLARAVNGRDRTLLARTLASTPKNEDVVQELYLRCLSREPKNAEIATAVAYVAAGKDRTAAFEDVLWVILNSTEFLQRP